MNMETSWERIKTHRKRLDNLEVRGLALVLFRGHEEWLARKLGKRDDEALAIEFLGLLGADGSEKAVNALLALLDSGDEIQQVAAAEALKGCPSILTMEPLKGMLLLQNHNAVKAGEVILSYGDEGADRLYSLWYKDTKPSLRTLILELLTEIKDPRVEELAFLAFLANHDGLVDAALKAAESQDLFSLWGNVCGCLANANWKLRGRATRLLGQWQIRKALPYLIDMDADPDPWVEEERIKAIERILAK